MDFGEPRGFTPVELDAQVALLPRDARCKGMFFQDVIEQASRADRSVDLQRAAGLSPRRYIPMMDYPHADWMRLAVAAAGVVNPQGHVGDGLRILGHQAYGSVFRSPLGKVLFGPFGFDLERVVAHAGLGYRLGLSFGRVSSEQVSEAHFRVTFQDMPTFLETYQVGVIEGAIQHYKHTPTSRVAMSGWSKMVLDVKWE